MVYLIFIAAAVAIFVFTKTGLGFIDCCAVFTWASVWVFTVFALACKSFPSAFTSPFVLLTALVERVAPPFKDAFSAVLLFFVDVSAEAFASEDAEIFVLCEAIAFSEFTSDFKVLVV